MTPLRQRTLDYLLLKGYAESTRKTYIYHLQEFALHFNTCPSTLEEEHVIIYLAFLRRDKQRSASTISQAYSAIKILFTAILAKPWNEVRLPRPKREKNLPIVLSVAQVNALIDQTSNLKHRTLLMLTYGAGLRLGEVSKLRVRDINIARKVVFVRRGKGNKDRYTILPDKVIDLITTYRKQYRPRHWLFEGIQPTKPLALTSIQSVYQQAKRRAGIEQAGGIHQLRHCFATHLVESGTSIQQVQKLLGHSSIRTTLVYLHLANDDFVDIEHPLDRSE